MKFAIFAILTFFVSSGAFAEDKTYSLTLTGPEVDVIGKSLVEQPYKIVAPVFDKIKKQVEDQNKPPETKPISKTGDVLPPETRND